MQIKIISATPRIVTADANLNRVGFESWLPFASKALRLSSDPNDFLIQPVPILVSDLPNRNGVAFPLAELSAWNVERGCQAYAGWRGMPMFLEHRSDDHTKALGVIIDVAMRPIKDTPYWKVIALAAVDRTKDPTTANKMEKGLLNTYSMGAMVNGCKCSYCGAEVGQCSHINADPGVVSFYELNGQIVHKRVYGVNPYELSVVEDPAYSSAIGGNRLMYG